MVFSDLDTLETAHLIVEGLTIQDVINLYGEPEGFTVRSDQDITSRYEIYVEMIYPAIGLVATARLFYGDPTIYDGVNNTSMLHVDGTSPIEVISLTPEATDFEQMVDFRSAIVGFQDYTNIIPTWVGVDNAILIDLHERVQSQLRIFEYDGVDNYTEIFYDPSDVFATVAPVETFVWDDINGNGLQDVGEPGIAGVSVELISSNNDNFSADGYVGFDPPLVATTDAMGIAQFSVRRGRYQLLYTLPQGYEFTDRVAGSDLNSDVDPMYGTNNGTSITFEVAGDGTPIIDIDAGMVLSQDTPSQSN